MNKIIIAIGLIGSALLYSYLARQNLKSQIGTDIPQESLLTSLPKASFAGLDGTEYSIHDQIKMSASKLVLIHYWATWCGPCEAELPELMSFLESVPRSSEVLVLIIAVNDEISKIQKFLAKLKQPTNVKIVWLLDNKNIHREVYGTTKLPESYLFNSEGKFLRKLLGPQEWQKPMFIDMFALYLP